MANTKKVKTIVSDDEKSKLDLQVNQLIGQLKQRLEQYEKLHTQPYHIQLTKSIDYDFINPTHYVGDDGRQTWERMVDRWGLEKTALWCEMTAFKYIDTRIGKKPNEDTEREMKKVEWYENKSVQLYRLAKQEDDEKAEIAKAEKEKKNWFN